MKKTTCIRATAWRAQANVHTSDVTRKPIVQNIRLCLPKDTSHSDLRDLCLKEAYMLKSVPSIKLPWTKLIWNKDILPSKAMTIWKLTVDKLPTDEQLMTGGRVMASLCSLCRSNSKNMRHLFFSCSFAMRPWNPVTFNNISHTDISTIIKIKTQISCLGKNSNLCVSSSMDDFMLLKAFDISFRPPRAPSIKEVIWKPSPNGCLKCNYDGSFIHKTTCNEGVE
ncbi:uncharacterized protein LOC131627089 [Vicia villosa]|uniref:uncharacterized protein LOC131627089 n=1 Tax=Vicia villosa TaxID=3911 RepID=UPI00273ABF22|nr:uncharacterized protein LOC131627089 [Vicia villosa]